MGDALRDLLIELVRNAFIHGQARICKVHIEQRSIRLDDDGIDFDRLTLKSSQNGRGGRIAVRHLLDSFGHKLVICSRRIADGNQTVIAFARSQEDLYLADPCCVSIGRDEINRIRRGILPAHLFLDPMKLCRVLYIVLPRYMPPSDAIILGEMVPAEFRTDKQLVFVCSDISWFIHVELERLFRGCALLDLTSLGELPPPPPEISIV
ncbi:MAG TPA: hypothetical protein VGF13_10665 [Verrucomicrobiae bacterium]